VYNIPWGAFCSVTENTATLPVPNNACTPPLQPVWSTVISGPVTIGNTPQTVTVTNILTCGRVDKVCTPPLVMNAAHECVCPPGEVPGAVLGQCICPPGSQMINGKCVTVDYVCPPPLVMNSSGTCVCPPPLVPGPVKNQCICPPGSQMVNGKCVVIDKTCTPPLVMNAAGQCACPEGTHMLRGRCVKNEEACKPPLVMNAAGECVRKPIVCPANMTPNATGRACVCEPGLIRYRGTCQAPAPRKERVKPAPRKRIVCELPARLVRGACVVPRQREREQPQVFPRDIPRIPGIFPGGGRGDSFPRGNGDPGPGPRGGGGFPGRL
jgi:hypothetical protein